MKKLFLLLFLFSTPAFTASLSVLDEAEQMGTIGGLAEACQAKDKLDIYELIAVRLIANKSHSEEEEREGYNRYAAEKLNAMREHRSNPKMTCNEILNHFNKLPIFKSIVYQDGSLKMYDGTFYPARGIYTKKK